MIPRKTLTAAIAGAALLTMTTAPGTASGADAGPYFGVGYAHMFYDETGVDTLSPSALAGLLGVRFTPNFAIEGRIGVGLADDSTVYLGVPVSLEIDNFLGGYARVMAPFGAGHDLYAIFGFTRGKLSASANNLTVSETETDASYGFGVDVALGRGGAVRVEYLWVHDKPGYTLDALSIGYVASF